MIHCECNDFSCDERIDVDDKEYFSQTNRGRIFISNKCKRGPEIVDKLVEKKETYTIYGDRTSR